MARLGERASSCLSKYGGCPVQTGSPPPHTTKTTEGKASRTTVPGGFGEVRFLKINSDVKIARSVPIKKDDARDVRETQVGT